MIFYFVLSGQLAISYAYAYPPLFTYYPDRKVQTIKDLEKPWAALTPRVLRPAPPALQSTPSSPKWTGHSAATTLLLDDSHAKAALQPHNHLCIPEYTRTQRNADLAAFQLEHAMQQQHSTTVSHQEGSSSAARDATTNTRAHERAVSSPDGTSTSTEIEQADNKRKRKKTKKKRDKAQAQTLQQLAAIAAAADGGASPAPPAAVFDETLLAVIGILHAARLQCSIAGWLRARALFHPPPPLSEPGRAAAAAGVMGDGGGDGDGDGNAAKTWCDDPVLVRAWASRGREAMHELGLKVEHGVES
jgi:hypothetical protein